NDSFFKVEVDADEDLTALDRSIVPIAHNTYTLVTNSLRFGTGYISTLSRTNIILESGTIANPALSIGASGLSNLAGTDLSFVAGGLEAVRLMTSGMLVRAANDTQFKIENTFPGSEALWSIGAGSLGLSFTDMTNTPSTKLE